MACQHFPDDQTLRQQTGAGEDDIIHLPSGLDSVDCERQEEEEVTLNCPPRWSGSKVSASKTSRPGFYSRFRRGFFFFFFLGGGGGGAGPVIPVTLNKIGTPVAILRDAWSYKVCAGTGLPVVSIL